MIRKLIAYMGDAQDLRRCYSWALSFAVTGVSWQSSDLLDIAEVWKLEI